MRLRATGNSTFLVLHLDSALVRGQMASLSCDEAADLPNIPFDLSLTMSRGTAFWRRVASFWERRADATGDRAEARVVAGV